MGCGSSRPSSARSWQAADGWVEREKSPSPAQSTLLPDGRLSITEAARERATSAEAGPIREPECREFAGGQLGLSLGSVETVLASLRPGQVWEDPEFPAEPDSLFYSDRVPPGGSGLSWLRPSGLVRHPHVLVDGISRDDIMQGDLGDCWFLSSCAAIAQNPRLMAKVLPEQARLFGDDYKGAVRVRFWRFGQWVDVWVDDRLPCSRDRKILFAHNTEPSEFWVALIEKAYAKIHGSYEAIEGGQAMDALVDLTGGLAERYELSDHTFDLYLKLSRANQSGSFITCSRKGDWKAQHNTVDEFGLIAGHAYTVTDAKRVLFSLFIAANSMSEIRKLIKVQ